MTKLELLMDQLKKAQLFCLVPVWLVWVCFFFYNFPDSRFIGYSYYSCRNRRQKCCACVKQNYLHFKVSDKI